MSEPSSPDGGAARSDAASRLAALLADVVERPAPTPDAPAPTDRPGRRIVRSRPRPVEVSDPDGDDDLTRLIGGAPSEAPAPPEAPAPAEAPVAPSTEARRPPSAPHGGPPTQPVPVAAPAPVKGATPSTGPVAARTPAAPRRPAAPTSPPPAASTPTAAAPPGAAWVGANAEAAARGERDAAVPPRTAPRFTLRAAAFGVAFAVLVAAVPALGWVGKERLLDSRGGVVVEGTSDPTEPGFRAAVEPTRTALVVHRDADGRPASATVLSLLPVDGGGTVLLIPLTLEPKSSEFFRTIIDGYDATENDDGFRRSIEDVIGVSVPPPIIDVTDESLATLVAPVAPLEIDVVDPVVLEDGTELSGEVTLEATDVGPFLRATREGEPEIARLERSADLWAAWLEAIQEAEATEPIGAAATGIGSFLRELTRAEFAVETLDVVPGEPAYVYQPESEYPLVPGEGMNEQVIDAIPQPRSPREDTRFDIELVNGAEGGTPPSALMHDLTLAGGSLIYLVNADEFGQEETTVAYADEQWRDAAEMVAAMLGPSASVEALPPRRAESETEDLVITFGTDVLERYQEEAEESGG